MGILLSFQMDWVDRVPVPTPHRIRLAPDRLIRAFSGSAPAVDYDLINYNPATPLWKPMRVA